MIKVIKEGKKEFITICENCGTEFSYELSDINKSGYSSSHVRCPLCNEKCFHTVDKKHESRVDENQIYPYKSYFNDELGVWVNPCTDPYEKIPYWMRPDYKAPEVTCKGTTDPCSSDSSNFDYSTVSIHNTLGSMTLETDSLSNS